MAASDPWKRYLEAGMELTEVTRARAEKVVKDLVKAGEVPVHEAQQWIEDLMERSRKTTESLAERVRDEVTKQMQALGLVQPVKRASSTAKKTAKKTTTTATKTAKKAASTTKKATGRS
jgi:polyhydroxyalkanoate synthesis regulator phasin